MIRLILAVLALAMMAAPSGAAPLQLFLAHAQQHDPQHDPAAAAADEFRRQIARLSGGRMKVEILADGVVGGNRDTASLVEKGVIHFALVTVGGVTPLFPPLAVTQLPFAFDREETARAVLDGPFATRLGDELAARSTLRLLGFIDAPGFHVLTTLDREVRTPDDMWGLRIRAIPGAKPLEAMILAVDAVPVQVSSREEFSALSTGLLDGQMNPPSVVVGRAFDTVQAHATLLNALYVPYLWIANKALMDALPPEDRQVVQQATQAAKAEARRVALSLQKSERGLLGLKKRLAVVSLTAAERERFKAAMQPDAETAILAAIGAEGERWMTDFKTAIRAAAAYPRPR